MDRDLNAAMNLRYGLHAPGLLHKDEKNSESEGTAFRSDPVFEERPVELQACLERKPLPEAGSVANVVQTPSATNTQRR